MPRSTFALSRAGLAALLLCAARAPAAQPDALAYPNTSGFGIEFNSGEDWHRQCMRVAQRAPAARPRTKAAACKATDLYYRKRDQAATSKAEWQQVRDCAQASGDDAVLMMLYANGYGVARDPDRALHHACKLDSAKAEMEGRVAHLASSAHASDSQPFDLCDHVTSGRMGWECMAIRAGRDDRVRSARLERFAATLPAAARAPFARLRAAAAAFTQASAGEVDMSGSGGPGFTIEHKGRRDQEFVETLLEAAGGSLPRANAAQLAQMDRELNAYYRQLLGTRPAADDHPERIGPSTVTRKNVRSAERAWLAYRDSWAAFLAAAKLPTDIVSVKAELTRQRIVQLKQI